MSDKLLKLIKANRPIEELTDETDYFEARFKGDIVKDFIEKISDNKEAEIQMIAL